MNRPTITRLQDLTKDDMLTALVDGGVDLPLDTAHGPQTLTLNAASPAKSGDNLTAVASPSGIKLPAFSSLAQLVAGARFDVIPSGVPVADSLDLSRLTVVINPASHRITAVVVELSSAKPWHLFPHVSLDALTFAFTLVYPFSPAPSSLTCEILGTFHVNGIALEGDIMLPSLALEARIQDGTTVPLAQLLQVLLPSVTLPDFTVTSLRLGLDPLQRSYSFRGELTDWQIAGELSVTDLLFSLSGGGLGEPSGSFTGALVVGESEVTLSAEKSRDTAGFKFTGDAQDVPVGPLLTDLGGKLGVTLPKFIDNLSLDHLSIAFDTDTKDFSFSSDWKSIGTLGFNLYPAQSTLSKTALLAYRNTSGAPTGIKQLVQSVSSDLAAIIPDGLTITLKDALFASCQPNGTSKVLFGLDIDSGIDLSGLSGLPLVGKMLPADQTVKVAYQILAASQAFTQGEVQALTGLFGSQSATLPQAAIDRGMTFRASFKLGSETHELSLPLTVDPSSGQIKSGGSAPSSGVRWFSLQKTFGPVHFDRVGLGYHDNELWVMLDGALGVGGLSVGLSGLGVSTKLTPLAPEFHLDGLSIDYKKGPLEIGGAFLRKENPEEFAGIAVVQTQLKGAPFSLHAIGSYASYGGNPSLFLYAVLDYPLGGPPFFFVEGLAAGFGYNRSLTVPGIDGIADFPLVREAMGADAMPDIGKPESQAQILQDELAKLDKYVTPHVGAGFLTIGVKFSSFKMLNSFALLTVELGDRFEIDLLGLSNLTIPFNETAVTPLAEVQMELKASFAPAEGFIGVIAVLDKSSYIVSKDCHLTGGFAFYTWLFGDHGGDFVVTLGGYHPQFAVPSHYPQVPRLGLNWRIDGNTFVKGECYFALCAHALMAGERMEASYHSGSLHASFRIGADFLISWKPYHYDIHAYVDIRASLGFLGPIDVGVDLHLWGPEFGGKARIHAWLFSATVSFGNHSGASPTPIDWSTFQSSFLPADAKKMCGITASGGLTRQLTSNGAPLWVVNPKQFAFTTDSFIPAKQVYVGRCTATSLPVACTALGIRSMAIPADDLVTTQRITIIKDEGGASVESQFNYARVSKKAPSALWGEPKMADQSHLAPPDVNGPQFVVDPGTQADPTSGFLVSPKALPRPGVTHDISTDVLRYNTDLLQNVYDWSRITPFQGSGADDAGRRSAINSTVCSSATTNTRNQILQALGFNPPRDVQIDPDALGRSFVIAPQVR